MKSGVNLSTKVLTYPLPFIMRNLFNQFAVNQIPSDCDKYSKTPTTTQLMEVMGQYFRPEFLARLPEIVPFSPINETMLLKIFNIQLKGLIEAQSKQGIELEIDEATRKMLAEKGFTPKYGARQIASTIRTHLRRPIYRLIVGNKLVHGQKLTVGMDENEVLTWDVK